MDPSWCPGCDRLILPKRVVVPVDPTPAPFEHDSSDSEHHPPPPPAPTPVPSSPEVRRKPVDQQAPRAQRRLGGGLVHGTGRVRPGGGLRKEKKQQPPQQVVVEPQQPAPAPAPKKTRVLISQEPTPLYCSEECRIRDLKNSFIQSEGAGFAAAPAAFNRVNQLELVQETIRRLKSCRPTYAASQRSPQSTPSTSPETPTHDQSYPLVPPNSLTETPKHPIFRTDSMSSCGSYASNGTTEHDTDSTIRIPRTKKTHPPRVPSWGSPSKSSLAPTVRTLYNASSSSLDTMAISATLSSGASPLFEGGPVLCTAVAEAEDTASTTPSRSSEGSNGKKKKRVSFASDSKPAPPRLPRMSRPKNPLLEANPVRAALSLSPKDRLVRPSSLPTTTAKPAPSQHHSKSTPDLARLQQQYSSLRSATETPPKNPYGVAMWPEDEKRSTPCTQVHGDLLRGYAKKFAPREGRSLVYSNIWTGLEREEKENSDDGLIEEVEEEERGHDERDDGEREYWRRYEERERERRAKRKAEEEVRKLEEARVIREMLGGVGCNEEDQPQARKMGKIAYDGMPGPAENRGLKYDFNHFLYDLIPPKPKIVERTVKRWDPTRKAFVEEICREEVFPERKKLFNFDD